MVYHVLPIATWFSISMLVYNSERNGISWDFMPFKHKIIGILNGTVWGYIRYVTSPNVFIDYIMMKGDTAGYINLSTVFIKFI